VTMVAIASAFSALVFFPTSTPRRFFRPVQTRRHNRGRLYDCCSRRSFMTCRQRSPPTPLHAGSEQNFDKDLTVSQRTEPPPSSSSVRVYDGVFSPSACLELVELAEDHSYRATNSDGSSVFYRRTSSSSDDEDDGENTPLTPLEQALDSVLSTLGDESPWVEYWSRMEHLNMDVHADIDEELLEDGDDLTGEKVLRCPTTGHVLYLDVEEGVRGPTCVFPDRLVGWNGDGYNMNASGKNGGSVTEGRSSCAVTMVTIPAVQGRLVRFDGRAMHAVPRPADRWLLPEHEERAMRLSEEMNFDKEDDGDENEWMDEDESDWMLEDAEDESDDPVRAVLLFNTWVDDPPRGVDRDPVTGAPPSGIEILEDDTAKENSSHADDAYVHFACQDASDWVEVSMHISDILNRETNAAKRVPVRVNLMGSRERRVHSSKCAELSGPGVSLKSALVDPSRPSILVLNDPNDSC